MDSEVYPRLNKAWIDTTKILFGQGIGELKEFEHYLQGAAIGQTVKSCFSGKPVWAASRQYSKKAKFFDYVQEQAKFDKLVFQPLNIKEIKDIDSLLGAIRERLVYGGDKVLGNSKYVAHSDSIVDSTAILNSSMIIRSKYVAYSYTMRDNEYTFGSTSSGKSSYIVRCFYNTLLQRCFECSYSASSSDCYFSYNVHECTDNFLCFNLRAKRFMVGNVQLGQDSYRSLKAKLLAEIADELKANKKLDFSIMDLMNNA